MIANSRLPYQRYSIETKTAHPIVPIPPKFCVKVKRFELAKLLIKEAIKYRNLDVLLSRPCVYGVFSGPIGGFAPREKLCVGCLRCTTQYPEMVEISHNPKYHEIGDSFFTSEHGNTVLLEAENGRVPIRGAGYRGIFGGKGWDGLWTDMSEIVRPTRDGIHGREYISTHVDIGITFPFLKFNDKEEPIANIPKIVSIPVPILFDRPSHSLQSHSEFCKILSETAAEIQTCALFSIATIQQHKLTGPHIIPLFEADVDLGFKPLFFALEKWNDELFDQLCKRYPQAIPILYTDFEDDLIKYYHKGIKVFYLTADYHGRGKGGEFVLNLIRNVHKKFLEEKIRGEVSLIGTGGMIAAEHVPKAIICGLDAVAINTSLVMALQGVFKKRCDSWKLGQFSLPSPLPVDWGKQRLKNLIGSWRDQLLEILGAMGLREVRRMRGEIGRILFQQDLEKEAFKGIKGYQ